MNKCAKISEALEVLGKATTNQLHEYTKLDKVKIRDGLLYLKENNYISKGDYTGRGNENYWVLIRPYTEPKHQKIDWSLHYEAFHNLVRCRFNTAL